MKLYSMPVSNLFPEWGRQWSVRSAATLLALVAWPVGHALAQPRALHFQHLQTEDGLSQRSVFAIHQDQHGFIWLGTEDGLTRWDGHNFTVYSDNPRQPASLTHGQVRCLAEDAEGGLWVGTHQGLGRMDPTTRNFRHFRRQPGDPNSLSGAEVRDLLVDREGFLWVATRDGGIDRIEIATGVVNRMAARPGDPLLGGAMALASDDRGGLWIGLRNGLAILPPGGDSPERILPDQITDQIDSLHHTPDGPLWAGTENGLLRIDVETREIRHFRPDPLDPQSLTNATIRDILDADGGHLWIATAGGLHFFDSVTERFVVYQHDERRRWSLASDDLLDLYRDRAGLLWIGTRFSGVDRVDISQKSFISIEARPESPAALGHPLVVSFAEGRGGELWVATFDGGLYESDLRGTHFELVDATPPLDSKRPMSLLVDHAGDLWVGTQNAGLAHRPRGAAGFSHYRHRPDDPASLAANAVPCLLEDSAGRLWIGTFRGGLDLLDRDRGIFEHHRHQPNDPTSIGGDIVQALVEGTDGQIWVGLIDGGLDRLHVETRRFEHFEYRPGDPTSLPPDAIFSLHLDDQDRLWISTVTSGLALLQDADGGGSFRTWDTSDGLPNNTINGVETDADGRVWISTDRGIARLDPETNHVRTFRARHGLPFEVALSDSQFRASDGSILFGGIGGLVIFDPGALEEQTQRDLPIALTALEVGNRSLRLHDLDRLITLEAGHQDRTLKIAFAALDFAAPGETEYRYRLDGFDDDWIDMGRLRPVTYTNLQSGEYRFRVSACTADGLCNEEAFDLRLQVATPLWKTWWVLLTYAVMAVGVIYGGIRWRLEGLRRRSAEL